MGGCSWFTLLNHWSAVLCEVKLLPNFTPPPHTHTQICHVCGGMKMVLKPPIIFLWSGLPRATIGPGEKMLGPRGQCHHRHAWHPVDTAAATTIPLICGTQTRVLLGWGPREWGVCHGGGRAASQPPASPPRPQGGEAQGLPACLPGRV